jgi:hypothetical protein
MEALFAEIKRLTFSLKSGGKRFNSEAKTPIFLLLLRLLGRFNEREIDRDGVIFVRTADQPLKYDDEQKKQQERGTRIKRIFGTAFRVQPHQPDTWNSTL